MIRSVCVLASFAIIFFSCQNNETAASAVNTQPKSDSGKAGNTSTAISGDVQKFLDSIKKANGGKLNIVSISKTGDTDNDTANEDPSLLKLIDKAKLEQLERSSSKKYTLVHCWASWCGPCRKEFPAFIKSTERLKNTEVILVSFDYDTEVQRKKILSIYHKLNTTLPVYMIGTLEKNDIHNVKGIDAFMKNYDKNYEGGFPYNLLIENKTGKVVASNAHYEKILDHLNSL